MSLPVPFDPAATYRRVLTGVGGWSVVLARVMPASVEQVWSACTDPDRLPQWLGRPEGRLEYGSSFSLYGAACEVVGCQPPTRLELSWRLRGETNTFRLTVVDRPAGTELGIEHGAIRSAVMLGYGPSWEERLLHLHEHLLGLQVPQHDCRSVEAVARQRWAPLMPAPGTPAPGTPAPGS